MRPHIVLEEAPVEEAFKLTGASTQREPVPIGFGNGSGIRSRH
ncbi:type II toxin-antitoxin system VapB family antitoxin [Methylohalobius crimeensis]|nr:type II toxin-antitoxin system VapB family antitoxin [Methylohalobius crimeensis]